MKMIDRHKFNPFFFQGKIGKEGPAGPYGIKGEAGNNLSLRNSHIRSL